MSLMKSLSFGLCIAAVALSVAMPGCKRKSDKASTAKATSVSLTFSNPVPARIDETWDALREVLEERGFKVEKREVLELDTDFQVIRRIALDGGAVVEGLPEVELNDSDEFVYGAARASHPNGDVFDFSLAPTGAAVTQVTCEPSKLRNAADQVAWGGKLIDDVKEKLANR